MSVLLSTLGTLTAYLLFHVLQTHETSVLSGFDRQKTTADAAKPDLGPAFASPNAGAR
jgi:hypothetical protein